MRDTVITNDAGEALICEYVNVAEDDSTQKQKSWSKKWGELLEDTLYVYPNRKPNTQLQNKYKIKGCEIHPAVKETGRILAFKIVNNDKVVIILEPLNIKDMGRWISSLFAAIQGIYSSTVLQSDEVKHDDSHPIVTKPIHQTISDEKLDFIVNVRSLAQKFEKMSTSDGPKTPNIKRTQSSPNLRNVYRRDRDSEVIVIDSKKQSETIGVTLREKATRQTESGEDKNQDGQRTAVRSWRGSYLEQAEERVVLSNVNNPALAKQKLIKQEQQIQRLEVTVKSIIERVERQKKALDETNAIIKKLKSQATGPEDEKEISLQVFNLLRRNKMIELDEQRSQLQKQISQSEQNIEEYKENIQSIEQEMIQLSKHLGNDRPSDNDHYQVTSTQVQTRSRTLSTSNVSTSSAQDAAKTLPTMPSSKINENGDRDDVSDISEPSSDEEIGMDKPAWAREAQRKSKKAAKILRKQGILT